ncbi:RPL27 [Symbiodinium sp. CCMP2456]|nr:RPL27 [Symbiodinium sp. CCMP2456]
MPSPSANYNSQYGDRRRRRRSEGGYGRWDHSRHWQWRSEHWASTSAAGMNINRADDRYRGVGENWYYRAVPGQSATEEGMNYVTCGMMSTTTPTSELVLMHDAFGWADRPGFMNVPAAAPVPTSPPSNDVKNIMANMVLLRGMGAEQAARILKATAAMQGPYED